MKIDLVKKYKNAGNRLILLDYDGTLVSFFSSPGKAILPLYLFDLLNKLCQHPSTKIVIVTGRKQMDIESLIGDLPIDIIAEHGAMIKEKGIWTSLSDQNVEWKKAILPLMNEISAECLGTFLEEKHFSLTWHYRNTDPISGYIFSRELIRMIEGALYCNNLRILDGNKVIEVMPNNISKGLATLHLLQMNEYDYVLAIGDDKTDEDMFGILLDRKNCHTIKVGYGKTMAKYKLDGVSDVLSLLKYLS